jgi:hypothetical protein
MTLESALMEMRETAPKEPTLVDRSSLLQVYGKVALLLMFAPSLRGRTVMRKPSIVN